MQINLTFFFGDFLIDSCIMIPSQKLEHHVGHPTKTACN